MEWTVIIEESIGYYRRFMSWRITHTRTFTDLDLARKAAEEWAHGYEPRHPRSPQNREIFRVGDDTWLINVEGTFATFHFRVSLAQKIAQEPQVT